MPPRPTPNVSESAKLYQLYKAFVRTPGGRPPFWLTALELATFREIFETPDLRDAMEDLSHDFAQCERGRTAIPPALRDLLEQLDDAPIADALLAYGALRAHEHFPNDYDRRIDYARTFESLGERLARLEAARPQLPFSREGSVAVANGGGFTKRAANDA